MYSPLFLNTENHLNKVLKKQRKTKHNIAILFTSLWDKNSLDLIEKLKRDNAMANLYGLETGRGTRPLYVVNSFLMPHAFVIFNTFRAPALVRLVRDSVKCEDYLPKIYEELGL